MSDLTTPSSTPRGASDLISTLLGRSPRLATALAAGQLAFPAAKAVRQRLAERSAYTVKVAATDEIYDELHEWVLSLLPPRDQRALVAWTSRRGGGQVMAIGDSDSSTPPRLRLRYDGSREQSVTIGTHRIVVVVNDSESAAASTDARYKPAEIVFKAPSLEAQKALLHQISLVAQRSHEAKRKPVVRMLNKWGDWQRLDDLPERDLDSVILPSGQLERLVADVALFLDSEADYIRRCVPWHRGHLYEGPPGTGKTSVARALASHFGMDIWYLPLADVDKDCDLLGVVNRITPRSMLLLEDADVFHAATQRDDEKGVTLSGLLNALDGIATPHGLFTALTTNTPEILDRAVIRAGRVDMIEHFSHADDDQVGRLLTRWYGRPVELVDGLGGRSPAEVIEACKRCEDPEDAMYELSTMAVG